MKTYYSNTRFLWPEKARMNYLRSCVFSLAPVALGSIRTIRLDWSPRAVYRLRASGLRNWIRVAICRRHKDDKEAILLLNRLQDVMYGRYARLTGTEWLTIEELRREMVDSEFGAT